MPSIVFKIARICHSPLKCNYLKSEKLFLNFLFHFWNLQQILDASKEKIIVIANVFPKLQTVKNLVRPISKKQLFRTRFDSQHVKLSQILAKSTWEHFYHVFSSFSEKVIWKMFPLVLGEISGVFEKYPVQDCGDLALPIQMQLSEKRKFFLNFLFWNLHQILNVLKKR